MYGERKHPCFCLMPRTYKCCRKRLVQDVEDAELDTRVASFLQKETDEGMETKNLDV